MRNRRALADGAPAWSQDPSLVTRPAGPFCSFSLVGRITRSILPPETASVLALIPRITEKAEQGGTKAVGGSGWGARGRGGQTQPSTVSLPACPEGSESRAPAKVR